jgi:hypothetical protein
MALLRIGIGKTARRSRGGKADSEAGIRKTVQLSDKLMDAIEERAALEVLPSATFIRRAIKQFLDLDPADTPVNVGRFAERKRTGSRGPLRQWPRGVSYVVQADMAEALSALAATRTEASEKKTTVADLVREAIVLELDSPRFPHRALPRDELGLTTSGVGQSSRSQQAMDEAWSATNE